MACASTKGFRVAVISATSIDEHDHFVDHLVAVEGVAGFHLAVVQRENKEEYLTSDTGREGRKVK